MKRKKSIKKFFLSLALLGMILPLLKTDTVYAKSFITDEISLSSEDEAAVVINVDTGALLYEKNGDAVHYPASITKVMTALLGVENGDLKSTVTYSKNAVFDVEPGSSSIARDVGEELTLEQVLYAAMLESCNSSAYAIAEHIGGDKSAFVDMMNERARELGCKNTNFHNPHGLPDELHTTTAYDMALIASEAIKNPKFAIITGTKNYQIPPTNKHSDITYLNNHHAMLNYYKTNKYLYDYCIGGKTGYTTVANSTLVTYARQGNMTLCCVIMNAKSPAHYEDTRRLFEYCFSKFKIYDKSENEELFDVKNDLDKGVLSPKNDMITVLDAKVILPVDAAFSDAKKEIVSYQDPENPDVIGKILYTYEGKSAGSATLLLKPVLREELPFLNMTEDEEITESYVEIDYKRILFIALIVCAAAGLIILFITHYDRILLWKHRTFPKKKKVSGDLPVIKRDTGRRRRRRR